MVSQHRAPYPYTAMAGTVSKLSKAIYVHVSRQNLTHSVWMTPLIVILSNAAYGQGY